LYIIIPLLLIAGSLLGVTIIVRRKMPYLRKLSPEAHQVGDSILRDYFPELVAWFRSIKWHENRQAALRETEKFLRRMRLVFLKFDHLSERLIKKVRKVHLSSDFKAKTENVSLNKEVPAAPQGGTAPALETPESLKAREQELIIEISQDPKNASLYETLGDLYLKINSDIDAREAYEAALAIEPNNQIVARKYSSLLKKSTATTQ